MEDELKDALEMLGTGYEPAAIIEQPTKKLILRDELGEEWTVAWVKLSTAFKPHIKNLHGSPLAVWLFISLSINRNGVAFPGIRTIAEQTGYSHQGVLDAITILEDKGYLKVTRGERKFNIYHPEFAAIGRINEPSESVKKVDSSSMSQLLTIDESTFQPDESSGLDLNKRNKNKPDLIDYQIQVSKEMARIDAAQNAFEQSFGFGALPWDTRPEWRKFGKWVVSEYERDPLAFGVYKEWRDGKGKFKGAMTNTAIRRDPQIFMDTGWPTFLAYESMYSDNDMVRLL
jgi:hypothetical protein